MSTDDKREPMVPPTNERLLAALRRGPQDPEAGRAALFQALSEATLLVPLAEAPTDPQTERRADLKCLVLRGGDNRALAGFTDIHALRRFLPQPDAPWAPLTTRTLCRIAVDGGFDRVVLNPGGPVGYELTPPVFQMLAQGIVPDPSGKRLPLQIGMPAQRPADAVIAALRDAAAQPGVREVYWFWIAIAGGPAHLGLAVDPPTPGAARRVGEGAEVVWKGAAGADAKLEVLALDDGDIARAVRENGERLYLAEET